MANLSNFDPSKLTFPEEVPLSKKKIEIPPALKFITILFYKSGTSLTFVYFLLIFIIQPSLEIQYSRRVEFNDFVLSRARTLLRTLADSRRLPTVAVKRGDKLYSDAQVQTQPDAISDNHDDKTKLDLISRKLANLKDTLKDLANATPVNELGPFTFQVRKIQGSIDAYRHAQLFKTGRAISGHSTGTDIKNDIRTVKGWYLRGEV